MRRLLLAGLVLAGVGIHAQESGTPKEKPATEVTGPASTNPATGTPSPTAGQGRPPIVIAASTDHADVRLQLPIDPSEGLPQPGDLELGELASGQNPNQHIVPKLELASPAAAGKSAVNVRLLIKGLVAFGDSTAPLFYKGRQIETLRFHKAGLTVRSEPDAPLVARENQPLLLVLENPSAFDYPVVRARVRFQDADVCAVSVDRYDENATKPEGDCLESNGWSSFRVPAFSQVSLRAPTSAIWFRDTDSGRARRAARRGTLTLRYQGEGATVFEQNLPVEVRFDPGRRSLAWSIAVVGFWLLAGAIISLVLRVSIPNYRRKKALKDQLEDARRATAEISDQVDSQLRVLLRVERLALDQRRRDGWVVGPGFEETAKRVEAGVNVLNRKIGLAQRLDAAACRLDGLIECSVSPTRADLIETSLSSACEGLKNDQLTEADWLLVQQRLEAADKALNEPTQEEKQAFEALLSQQWKSIRDHFDADPQTGELKVPKALESMKDCFPDRSLLPRTGDDDGTKWISSVGVVRADLQLTALKILSEVHFLAPVINGSQPEWKEPMEHLTRWLATPALTTLAAARRQLRQLSEGVSECDIVAALQNGEADIDLDPQVVNPNQTVRMTIRFRDRTLNDKTARGAIQCEWCFKEPRRTPLLQWKGEPSAPATASSDAQPCESSERQGQIEYGWRVHRYFEPGILDQDVEVRFFWKGKPILRKCDSKPATLKRVVVPRERTHHKKDRVERWLWRPLPQALQLMAALLVPLAALAVTTAGEPAAGQWWDLVGLGFGSETIRNILTGPQASPEISRNG